MFPKLLKNFSLYFFLNSVKEIIFTWSFFLISEIENIFVSSSAISEICTVKFGNDYQNQYGLTARPVKVGIHGQGRIWVGGGGGRGGGGGSTKVSKGRSGGSLYLWRIYQQVPVPVQPLPSPLHPQWACMNILVYLALEKDYS
jgi:hypothetical protein